MREKNGGQEVLLYTRKKNPFYGSQGFPTQKVLFGDSITDVAGLGFTDETGLSGNPQTKAIRHYRVYEPGSDEVREDKIMYIFLFRNPVGELNGASEGDYVWIKVSELNEKITCPLPELAESLDIILDRKEYEFFREDKHVTELF